jgi:membrane dipeptidase
LARSRGNSWGNSFPRSLQTFIKQLVTAIIRIFSSAKTGGVIGVTGLGYFLPDRASPAIALADCVTYVRDLVGADHVGLGLDYTPPDPKGAGNAPLDLHPDFWPPAEYTPPWPMKDASPDVFKKLAALLIERGWSTGDVRKVLGENFLRVARAVWK